MRRNIFIYKNDGNDFTKADVKAVEQLTNHYNCDVEDVDTDAIMACMNEYPQDWADLERELKDLDFTLTAEEWEENDYSNEIDAEKSRADGLQAQVNRLTSAISQSLSYLRESDVVKDDLENYPHSDISTAYRYLIGTGVA